jgi:sugar transferase (PEP-CTERM/EpsH1 system associated)
MSATDTRCHIVHLLYRFAAGGLENVIVQLINGLPHSAYRHTVIALTTVDAVFARRIQSPDVELIAMNKAPGQPFRMYPAMYRLLRRLQPDVFHSCNLAALEFAPVAALTGVRRRIHAEHGWDVADPDGSNRRYQFLRKVYKHFVQDFVAVSEQLNSYLLNRIGISEKRVHLVPNGVDVDRFKPYLPDDASPEGYPFEKNKHWVMGTVGRLEPIKNQPLLARAFVQLVQSKPVGYENLRLVIVGAGPLDKEIRHIFEAAGMQHLVWMPGMRSDIPEILRMLDCFVLPSLSEGTSCTLQEAMACGLISVVTDVGGNRQVLVGGRYGVLTPSGNINAMSAALLTVWQRDVDMHPAQQDIRKIAQQNFSLNAVLEKYENLMQCGVSRG